MAGTVICDYINSANVSGGFFGVGQTWQNVTASRVLGTTYTNTTGKPIVITVSSNAGGGAGEGYINNVQILIVVEGGDSNQSFNFIVPNGSTYKVTWASVTHWFELR